LAKVTINHLVKRFGNVVAVNDVSIDIRDKEFVVLLGPSGCGKTTTLRCIAGLETPDSGEIYIGDTLVNDLPPKDRDVAMVFQSYALYPHMSVFDNIAFPLKMRKVSKQEIQERVRKVAELLRIAHLLDRKPRQLSGGEAQRVALGRAIVRNPRVFLMDEPLSNLDAKLRLYMRAELKRLQRELGVTTVYVTHDQAEAMTMADRIAIMNLGVLQQVDTPDGVYTKPANTFVAGFIGSPPMNMVDCTLKREDGGAALDFGPFTYRPGSALQELLQKADVGPELVFGFRPEHINLSTGKVEGGLEAEVYVVEPLGSEIIVDLRFADHIVKAKTTEFRANPGDTVWVTFQEDKIHIFDKKTGQAIV
jgi:multiple sugar transport system ATP-binding protein